MRVLLDTKAYSALRLGDSVVAEQLRRSEMVLMSVIVGSCACSPVLPASTLPGVHDARRYDVSGQ